MLLISVYQISKINSYLFDSAKSIIPSTWTTSISVMFVICKILKHKWLKISNKPFVFEQKKHHAVARSNNGGFYGLEAIATLRRISMAIFIGLKEGGFLVWGWCGIWLCSVCNLFWWLGGSNVVPGTRCRRD